MSYKPLPAPGTTGNVMTSTGTAWASDAPAGGGAVDSVNGQTGVVVLDAADVGAVASGTNPFTDVSVLGVDAGGAFALSNLTHDSGTKTTSTTNIVSTEVLIREHPGTPATVADRVVIFADASNNLKAVKETGAVVRLDAIEVAQAGVLVGTRKRINFASGATVSDDAVNNEVDVTVSGGGTFGQTTATFSGGANSVTVTVSDTGVSAGSRIVPTVALVGRDADEMEMAPVVVAVGSITAGVGFDLIAVSLDGDAEGTYTINYTRD